MSAIEVPPAIGMKMASAEILDRICDYLFRDDLKNFGLSCKKARPSSHRALFHTIYLKIELDSFEICERSLRIEFSEYVKRLEYDGRTVELTPYTDRNELKNLTFEDWLVHCAGTEMDISVHDRMKSLVLIPVLDLQKCYRAHGMYIQGQNYLRRGGKTMQLLYRALSLLPHLASVVYSARNIHDHSISGDHPLDLSDVVEKRTLQGLAAKGDWDRLYEDYDIKLFWDACGEAKIDKRLKEIHLSDMDVAVFIPKSGSFVDIFGENTTLTRLALSFKDLEDSDPNRNQGLDLTKSVSAQACLQSLHLIFDSGGFPGERLVKLLQLVNTGQHWRFLKHLHWGGIAASYQDLTTLLTANAATLRCLEVSQFSWTKADPSQEAPKSWIDFFIFLNQKMMLGSFRIMHTLAGPSRDEVWNVQCYCFGPGEPCIKQKLVSYVLHCGVFHFKGVSVESDLEKMIRPESRWVLIEDSCFSRGW